MCSSGFPDSKSAKIRHCHPYSFRVLYSKFLSATEDVWCRPWTTISTQGYVITLQRRPAGDSESHIPGFIIEVVKVSTAPRALYSVLIVKIKNFQHWEFGIPALRRQLNRQIDTAFAGTAHSKVYWIGAIEPTTLEVRREEDNGQDMQPLIDWHHTNHDQASFDDLQILSLLLCFKSLSIQCSPILCRTTGDSYVFVVWLSMRGLYRCYEIVARKRSENEANQ